MRQRLEDRKNNTHEWIEDIRQRLEDRVHMTVDTGYTPLEDIEYTWQWKEDLCQRLEDSV